MDPDIILIFFLTFLGLTTGILALLFIYRLQHSGGVVMSYFQLHPDETTLDLRILYYAAGFEFVAFLIYAAGGLLGRPALLTVGRSMSVLYALAGGYIAYRWWMRFWPTQRGEL